LEARYLKIFNINSVVKVKLTDFGKKIHYEKYKQDYIDRWTSHDIVGKFMFNYKPLVEDENGYCEFQMWSLIELFGSYCGMGGEIPFETTILISEQDLKEESQ